MNKKKLSKSLSRREFLKAAGLLGLAAAGVSGLSSLVTSCQAAKSTVIATGAQTATVVSTQQAAQQASHGFSATMDDDNSLIFHIQGPVSSQGNVTVQYWSQGIGPFVTAPVATTGNTFSLEIVRLRPSTTYNYQVFLAAGSKKRFRNIRGISPPDRCPRDCQITIYRSCREPPAMTYFLLDYNCTDFNGMVVIDQDAQIVWYFQNDNSVFHRDSGK